MTNNTRKAALIFCAVIMGTRAFPEINHYKPQGYSTCTESDEITYEYYELPSDIQLTQTEFEAMKMLLSKAVSRYNHRVSYKYKQMKILSGNYGIQYEAKLDKKGNKIVEINAFAKEEGEQKEYKELTTKRFVVFDGGSSYFNTVINLKRKKAAPVFIHGFA
ncbi:hypothetical protein [Hymenobacter psoromatis]|uniref:hypothetical protein n=1 Tax=Hymenobacter psoromatis TaxID=1484116 RepID=UPI001CBB5E17|nr:hypothetical protein [Hymenobacter psoromatis]